MRSMPPWEFFKPALAELPVVEATAGAGRIGFIQTWSAHIWYQTIVRVMRARAWQYGAELVIEDTNSVGEQVEAITRLADEGVQVLIVVPAGESGYDEAVAAAGRRNVPIIAESDPLKGAATLVAIDDYQAGRKLGQRLGAMWAAEWETAPVLLDIGLPRFASCRNRSDGFLAGLCEHCPAAEWGLRVDGQAAVDTSRERAAEAFTARADINVVFGIDDESALGGVLAWHDLGRGDARLWVGTFGLAGDEEKRRLREWRAMRAGLLMFPEYVAVLCFDAAVSAAAGGSLAARVTVPTVAVNAEELGRYYRPIATHWLPDLRVVSGLPVESAEVSVS